MTEAAFAPQDAAALLRWYVDHGIDETIGEEAIDRFARIEAMDATGRPHRGFLRADDQIGRAHV